MAQGLKVKDAQKINKWRVGLFQKINKLARLIKKWKRSINKARDKNLCILTDTMKIWRIINDYCEEL